MLRRFSRSRTVPISHYKDIFNRPRQEWRAQKESPALILAARHGEFLYDASAYTPTFGHKRFHYNALALNCVYDCAYCYLQGMFPSAHIVLFVNIEDYFAATEAALAEGPLYLALSYDTDLPALEHIIPYTRRWIEFTRTRPGLTVEIRTKSASFNRFADITPTDNAVLAWTLSPASVAARYEAKTPPPAQRLRAAAKALEAGWRVRLCIDPVLRVPGWENAYTALVDEIAEALDAGKLEDVSLGVFRINRDYLKHMKRRAAPTDVLYHPYEKRSALATYTAEEHKSMTSLLRSCFARHIPADRIHIV
ncbi:MAG: hypothetical protein JJU00_14890 [Opitutales bacterium]|nr:hypothetical protein [Opitutales bacterium]